MSSATPEIQQASLIYRVFVHYMGGIPGLVVIVSALCGAGLFCVETVRHNSSASTAETSHVEQSMAAVGDIQRRLSIVEVQNVVSITDRAGLHHEITEARDSLATNIHTLSDALAHRLDRIEDKTDRIGDRVGVASPSSR